MRELISAFLVLLMCVGLPFAQGRARPKNVANRNIPFDKSVTSLPPGFLGIDGPMPFRELEKRKDSLTKGEFETTAQFNERVASAKKVPILPGLSVDSLLGFVLPADAIIIKYDADTQKMRVELPLLGPCSRFLVAEQVSVSKYDGTNILGARREVVKFSGSAISIGWGLNQVLRPRSSYPEGYFRTDLRFDPSKAALVKPKLRALVIGKLKDRLTDRCKEVSKPTYDRPFEREIIHDLIALIVDEIWIIDPTAGTVYARITQADNPS